MRTAGQNRRRPSERVCRAVSIYGLGKWPVTLYREQLDRLSVAMPEILDFVKANVDKLAVKPTKDAN